MSLNEDTIRTLPKVLLHDHLDGGVRPQTIIDLAPENGYDRLPTTDPDDLAAWDSLPDMAVNVAFGGIRGDNSW